MKKQLSICLVLLLCLTGGALAQTVSEPQVIEVQTSFASVEIEVPYSAIGFLLPKDFVLTQPTQEEAAQGVIVNAADAAGSYTFQASYASQVNYESLLAALEADSGVESIGDYRVNGNDYLSYVVKESGAQVAVVFLGENSDQALSFTFVIPQGVQAGTIPLEIMGSLYEL